MMKKAVGEKNKWEKISTKGYVVMSLCCALTLPSLILTHKSVVSGNQQFVALTNGLEHNREMLDLVTTESLVIATGQSLATPSYLSAREVSHLKDVSGYLIWIHRLAWSGLLAWGLWFFIAWKRNRIVAPQYSKWLRPVVFTVFFLAGMIIFFWEFFFFYFHTLLFPQGNWEFPASSLLIQAFPAFFWLLNGLEYLGLILFFALLFSITPRIVCSRT